MIGQDRTEVNKQIMTERQFALNGNSLQERSRSLEICEATSRNSGHRMRGPDGSWLFSSLTSRSKTTDSVASLTRLKTAQAKSRFCSSTISTGREHSSSSFAT
jgi:hypothetical protein